MKTSATASRAEIAVVSSAALAQGLALVTFPAASAIFTGAAGFGFNSTRYGMMFIPQVVLAILSSSLAPGLASRWSLRRVLLSGLAADIFSVSLLALSRLLTGAPDLAFGVLLVATGALGFGFGATVMALNTYAEAFFPQHADRAVLAVNALLGVGTMLAPALLAVAISLGAWWLLPIAVACMLLLISSVALKQPLRGSTDASVGGAPTQIGLRNLPHRFWFYAAAAFLYGILETLNGNWATLYLSTERGISAQGASLALAAFWGMATVGRVLISVLSRVVSVRHIYVVLPLLLFIALQASSRIHDELGGLVVFGLAGLACSAFLPLSISFGGDEFPSLAAVMAGELLAFYQIGYGVAAFGTGPLRDAIGLPFSKIFAVGSLVAIPMAIVAWLVQRQPLQRATLSTRDT